MLAIRLSRIGKKNESQFRILVQEKSKATSSRFIEQVGFYNPHTEPSTIQLKEERIKYWLSKGAQASPTVFNMLVAKKIVEGPSIPVGRPKKNKKQKKKKSATSELTEEKSALGGSTTGGKEEKPAEAKKKEPELEPKKETKKTEKDDTDKATQDKKEQESEEKNSKETTDKK